MRRYCAFVWAGLAWIVVSYPAGAATIRIERVLDVRSALGNPPPGTVIRGIAHDGQNLWLIRPSGDALVEVDPQTGQTIATHTLTGTPPVVAAGLTAGAGSLWLLDVAPPVPVLLQIDDQGHVIGGGPLATLPGRPVGVDFLPGSGQIQMLASVDRIRVSYRSSDSSAEGVYRYRIEPGGIVFEAAEPLPLRGARGRSTTEIGGAPFTWISAPRPIDDTPLGDPPVARHDFSPDELRVRVPDRSIPRGGEDLASTHALALTDPATGAIVATTFVPGPPAADMASSGTEVFLSVGNPDTVTVGQFLDSVAVQHGTCVCRLVKFYHQETFGAPAENVEINFAQPWNSSLCAGSTCDDAEADATGGYLAQRVDFVLDPGPPATSVESLTRFSGSGSITRQNRAIYLGDVGAGTVAGWHDLKMELCEGSHTVVPSLVGSLASTPLDILDLYTYDDDGDGFGDDNPSTDYDDYFTLDSSVVHEALLDSGALGETNLYDRVLDILHYVKRRHVYSGADDNWSTPEDKLQSPYSSCSPSAFMVVALAREAGIPARLVGTTKQRTSLSPEGAWRDDSFHRWAQVYMPPYGWVRIDATPNDPGLVGFTNVNNDFTTDDKGVMHPIYDECDRCTSDAQCSAYAGKTLADCNISTPFTNPNDVNADGVVDGDDVEIIGAAYYTNSRLENSSFTGVDTDDLITMVDAGFSLVDGDSFRYEYISLLTSLDGFKRGNPRYADWRECHAISSVLLGPTQVSWETSGPFQPGEPLRIDLYRLYGAAPFREYVYEKNLAHGVAADSGTQPVDLGDLNGSGNRVVVVTRQGRPYANEFSSFSGADWETFGESAPFSVGPPGPPRVPPTVRVRALDASASDLLITWDASSCSGASDYRILYGDGDSLPRVPGARFAAANSVCSIGGSSPFTWTDSPDPTMAPSGLIWFLVVSTDGANLEGSWGTGSDGTERAGPGTGGSSGLCATAHKDVSNLCGY